MNRRRTLYGTLAVVVALLATATARAEDVYVSDSANVLDNPGPASNTLLIANRGTALTVIERQGDWIHVQTVDAQGNNLQGWVLGTQVSGSRPGADFGAAFGGGNAGASEASAAAAGKGLDGAALDYAKSQNLDPKGAKEMEDERKTVTAAMWKAFCDSPEGKLGKGN